MVPKVESPLVVSEMQSPLVVDAAVAWGSPLPVALVQSVADDWVGGES